MHFFKAVDKETKMQWIMILRKISEVSEIHNSSVIQVPDASEVKNKDSKDISRQISSRKQHLAIPGKYRQIESLHKVADQNKDEIQTKVFHEWEFSIPRFKDVSDGKKTYTVYEIYFTTKKNETVESTIVSIKRYRQFVE